MLIMPESPDICFIVWMDLSGVVEEVCGVGSGWGAAVLLVMGHFAVAGAEEKNRDVDLEHSKVTNGFRASNIFQIALLKKKISCRLAKTFAPMRTFARVPMRY